MNNANGLSPAETERLSILSEELGESVQAVGKILRHGYESYNPDNPKETNRLDLEKELGDVYAAASMMYAAKDISRRRVIGSSRKKLSKQNRNLHHQPNDIASPRPMIIVAGSRSWNDYIVFCSLLEKAINMLSISNYVIVSGDASRGADAMAIKWATDNNINWLPFPADWNNLGKRAGFVRNSEMAEVATHLIAFWDGESNGTKNMVSLALDKEIPTLIFKVQPDKEINYAG